MDLDTLRTLKRNKKELLTAEQRILEAIAIDYAKGFHTEPVVTEKIFEISDLILNVVAQIEVCRQKLKKNKK
tara:strand:- start:818 stop:1033 length:216 start_codon:yes stop_codon:yes gene_type:complete